MFLPLLEGGVDVVAEGRQDDQLSLHKRFVGLAGLLDGQGLETLYPVVVKGVQ